MGLEIEKVQGEVLIENHLPIRCPGKVHKGSTGKLLSLATVQGRCGRYEEVVVLLLENGRQSVPIRGETEVGIVTYVVSYASGRPARI